MRPQEARWVGDALAQFARKDISPLLELGASSRHFREVLKPHIAQCIHRPLAAAGVQIVTSDLVSAEGVNIAGDIYIPQTQARLAEVRANCLLVCNIFEHVKDTVEFAGICDGLLNPSGVAIVTVPYSYPFHPDPIDAMFRPSPAEIAALFPGYAVLSSAVVASDTHRDDLRADNGGRLVVPLLRDLLKSALLRGGLPPSQSRLHRMAWLFRPYKVSCVVLRKPGRP
jgi:hypothetical protein